MGNSGKGAGLHTKGFGASACREVQAGACSVRKTEVTVVTVERAGWSVPTAHSKPLRGELRVPSLVGRAVRRGVDCFHEWLSA